MESTLVNSARDLRGTTCPLDLLTQHLCTQQDTISGLLSLPFPHHCALWLLSHTGIFILPLTCPIPRHCTVFFSLFNSFKVSFRCVCMCWCVVVCMCVDVSLGACVHMTVKARGQSRVAFCRCCLFFSLRQSLSRPGTYLQTRFSSQLATGILLSASPVLVTYHWFYAWLFSFFFFLWVL